MSTFISKSFKDDVHRVSCFVFLNFSRLLAIM
jgi:hypothetical protein